MTEAEWLACADSEPRLLFLRGKTSNRKVRLLAVAYSRGIWSNLKDERSRRAVEVAEMYADGLIDAGQMRATAQAAEEAVSAREAAQAPAWEREVYAAQAALWTASAADFDERPHELIGATIWAQMASTTREQKRQHRILFNAIFGNPFRPVAFDPAWRTSDVFLLARGIYEERAFDRMPILADALQDAGCNSDELLNHLRDTSAAHVRGCWALDLVLDKK